MRTYFLDIPFGVNAPKGSTYNSRLKSYTYEGEDLPVQMQPYQSTDFSLLRWKEDSYNRKLLPVVLANHRFTPRPHQKEAAVKIAKFAAKNYRGFIEGDDTGLGKTLASIYGIYGAMQVKKQSSAKVLIVCPKAAIPQWSNTLKAFPLKNARVCIVNYDQAGKLLKAPASAKGVKKAATKKKHLMTKGTPNVAWDYIVADESQKLKNWDTTTWTQAFSLVARYQDITDYPFVIWASATIGQTPAELRYLFPLMKQITKDRHTMSWLGWLTKYNFNVKENDEKGKWIVPGKNASKAEIRANDLLCKKDLMKLNKILFSEQSPSVRRRPEDIKNWPKTQRIGFGVQLSVQEFFAYNAEWLSFRSEMKLPTFGKNPKNALARLLRFRQKASLIRTKGTAEQVVSLLESGHKVAVYCEFMETIDEMRSLLEKQRYKVSEFTGRTESFRENERIAFQKNATDVILFSVDSAVSFHAGETLPDGTTASMKKRTTVIHDVPFSGIRAKQIEGRCHRDGQFAPIYYMYAMNTAEEKITEKMIARMANIMSIMDDEKFAEELSTFMIRS